MSHLGKPSRKAFLGSVVLLPALASALPALADASKSSQASMQYQPTPKDGKQCSQCNFFIPGSSATSNGTCKIVDGTIAPTGYCIAFNAIRP
ncbi:MAG TPA: high-potential iron-sulfur protein [Candidatus Tumulicola sp.]|nr:high-potential iron-sulfur protein [Candidatus Tumulicola sp.]